MPREVVRVSSVFALMVVGRHCPLAATAAILLLALSDHPNFWDRFGSVERVSLGGLAFRFRRP